MLFRLLGVLALITFSYVYGAVSFKDELFPAPQLRSLKRSVFPPRPALSYPDHHTDLREYFISAHPRRATVVMVGDSHIELGNWVELLGRCDVLNRGLGWDSTEMLSKRMDEIYRLQPKVAVVMLGQNDINRSRTLQETFSDYRAILEGLIAHHIRPVIHAVPLRNNPPYDEEINTAITRLNALLERYCSDRGIAWVNLNSRLAMNGRLDAAYMLDSRHLNQKGYLIWAEMLKPLLPQPSSSSL